MSSPTLPREMRAARLLTTELAYTFQNVPLPTPQPRELLIKVAAAGFCHTDAVMPMSAVAGPLPITGSHEPAGILVGMGEEAGAAGTFTLGERIMAVNTFRACSESRSAETGSGQGLTEVEQCGDCRRYHERWCSKAAMIGLRYNDGAFADYCLVDMAHAKVIPDGMSMTQAATFSCAGVTIYTSIKKSGVKPGGVLAIVGMGALGLVGVQMAKAMGIKVVGVDAREGPCKAAEGVKYRPDIIVNTFTPAEETVEKIRTLREPDFDLGEGADAVCMASDAGPALTYALAILRHHGTLVLTSGPPTVQIPVLDFIWKDFTAVGTQNGPASDMLEAAELCIKYGIRSQVRTFPFSQEGMEKMVTEVHGKGWSGKAVVVVDPAACGEDV